MLNCTVVEDRLHMVFHSFFLSKPSTPFHFSDWSYCCYLWILAINFWGTTDSLDICLPLLNFFPQTHTPSRFIAGTQHFQTRNRYSKYSKVTLWNQTQRHLTLFSRFCSPIEQIWRVQSSCTTNASHASSPLTSRSTLPSWRGCARRATTLAPRVAWSAPLWCPRFRRSFQRARSPRRSKLVFRCVLLKLKDIQNTKKLNLKYSGIP